jgi:hypothetical protein
MTATQAGAGPVTIEALIGRSRRLGARAALPSGVLRPDSRAALERLAHAAGYSAIREIIVAGRVKGSASGTDYVTYYREGWNRANGIVSRRTPLRSTLAASPELASLPQPPEGYDDPALEQRVRAEVWRSGADGQETVRAFDRLGLHMRFRDRGGTVNDWPTRTLYITTTRTDDGPTKPLPWFAASMAHEVSHAGDDARGRTPPTVSPLQAEYAAVRASGPVPISLLRALARHRAAYVRGQIDGEARAMSREARVLRGLENQGISLEGRDRTIIDTYGAAHDAVVKAAEAAAARSGTPAAL